MAFFVNNIIFFNSLNKHLLTAHVQLGCKTVYNTNSAMEMCYVNSLFIICYALNELFVLFIGGGAGKAGS